MTQQKPRLCPVSGMFLDEPEYGKHTWIVTASADIRVFVYGKGDKSRSKFEAGNCFATREDAERYAKHLKAMAKLRRLGDYTITASISREYGEVEVISNYGINYYNQLTPEEQNALLWPNEEK